MFLQNGCYGNPANLQHSKLIYRNALKLTSIKWRTVHIHPWIPLPHKHISKYVIFYFPLPVQHYLQLFHHKTTFEKFVWELESQWKQWNYLGKGQDLGFQGQKSNRKILTFKSAIYTFIPMSVWNQTGFAALCFYNMFPLRATVC